jgi:hypothetical protein
MFRSEGLSTRYPPQPQSLRKRFRFFLFDSMGRINHGLERECQNDAEAMGFAIQQTGAAMVEVWLEKRMIGKLYPSAAA